MNGTPTENLNGKRSQLGYLKGITAGRDGLNDIIQQSIQNDDSYAERPGSDYLRGLMAVRDAANMLIEQGALSRLYEKIKYPKCYQKSLASNFLFNFCLTVILGTSKDEADDFAHEPVLPHQRNFPTGCGDLSSSQSSGSVTILDVNIPLPPLPQINQTLQPARWKPHQASEGTSAYDAIDLSETEREVGAVCGGFAKGRRKNGRKFSCNKCPKSLATKSALEYHEIFHHRSQAGSLVRSNTCYFCKKTFTTDKNMREHRAHCARNPSRKGPFFCTIPDCLRKETPFKMKKLLNAHVRKEHAKDTQRKCRLA